MKTSFYVLNLTALNETTRNKKLTAKLVGVDKANQISSLSDIPDVATTPGALVLYVIGHAVPNGLIGPNNAILPEADVAKTIQKRRQYSPTLIVWDVCFAKSLLEITGAAPWTDNFVHIFSCQSYERTWHLGPPSSLESSKDRPTLFSIELSAAVEALPVNASWEMLEAALQERLSPAQRPEIKPKPPLPQPADFDLRKLVKAGATSTYRTGGEVRVPSVVLTAAERGARGSA
jgi:hypothetical protein